MSLAFVAVFIGERREALDRINKAPASTSDRELKRAERVLTALLRD